MGIKYGVKEDFFEKWSPAMAYVLGYLYADGSMEDARYLRGKYVRVTSVEKANILLIRELMGSEHTIVIREPRWNDYPGGKRYKGKRAYMLRIGNHKIYNALFKIGLRPNKSLTVIFPKIPQRFLAHFVRGYFDGDGCVSLYRAPGKYGQLIMKKLSVIFTSGSRCFLDTLGTIMTRYAKVKHNKLYNHGNGAYQLRYSTQDSIKAFKFLYGRPCKNLLIERKFYVFKTYFSLLPKRIDKEVGQILCSI